MIYKEIESYFESKEKTEKLLTMYEPTFLDIDLIDEKSKNNEIESEENINKIISQLNSMANVCSRISSIAGTYKTGEQTRLEYTKIQNADKKVNMTQLKAEASYEVHYLRRVRNLFNTYAESAGRALSTYKAKLFYTRKQTPKEEEN